MKLKVEIYEGIPNYYEVPDLYQFMKYQYKEELSKRANQLKATTQSINEQIFNLDDKSNISDGSHTFDELYFHRMILFSVICNQNPELAFKSKKHADGSMFDDYFICGISTQKGLFTYHYHKDYWDYFKVPEVDRAPKWDGHTAGDVTRLLTLEAE